MESVIRNSIECVNLLLTDFKDLGILEGFRARARSIPTDVAVHGVTYALTLIAARSNYKAIEVGLKAGGCREAIGRVKEVLKDEDGEKLSYGAYGAVIAYVMKSSKVVKSTSFEELIEETLKDPSLRLKAMIVFEWVKRFSEAYISG